MKKIGLLLLINILSFSMFSQKNLNENGLSVLNSKLTESQKEILIDVDLTEYRLYSKNGKLLIDDVLVELKSMKYMESKGVSFSSVQKSNAKKYEQSTSEYNTTVIRKISVGLNNYRVIDDSAEIIRYSK